jgi:GNAT superfamily N-acetyltransferase
LLPRCFSVKDQALATSERQICRDDVRMDAPAASPDWVSVVTAAERPDLWETTAAQNLFTGLWPEYNHHGKHARAYFAALIQRYAHLQLLLVDDRSGDVIARGRTIPFRWDGRLETLPKGIDALGLTTLREDGMPTSLSALAAEVVPELQGQGLSRVVIGAMASVAGDNGLAPLVAPVRPSWKDRYPLVPIEEYAAWEREDGLPFDPWLRVHVRLGGQVLRCERRSLEITAPVADWEQWTGMGFPGDGEYVFPGGLAPLSVRDGIGYYWEPNVWVCHSVS